MSFSGRSFGINAHCSMLPRGTLQVGSKAQPGDQAATETSRCPANKRHRLAASGRICGYTFGPDAVRGVGEEMDIPWAHFSTVFRRSSCLGGPCGSRRRAEALGLKPNVCRSRIVKRRTPDTASIRKQRPRCGRTRRVLRNYRRYTALVAAAIAPMCSGLAKPQTSWG